ncbi:hypothetical protein BACPU_12130 [Bacillus pumilus]|nr:hypothetical protein BACPU_12130 [Bacillus pumilus]
MIFKNVPNLLFDVQPFIATIPEHDFLQEFKIVALLIHVKDVFSHLVKLLEQTKFTRVYGDFIFIAEDFRFGLCIVRTGFFMS